MSKGKREIQREIYNFVADEGHPVILQTILDKFSKKYSCSERTVSRYLEEMCKSKNPFHLRTYYDKNRYIEVPVISLKGMMLSSLSIIIPTACFFVDLYDFFGTGWHLTTSSSFFVVGFWIAMWISVLNKGDRKG